MLRGKPIFIGLAGTLNAGKDSLGDVLANEHGFLHMSTSDMLRLIKKREFGADSPKALLLRNDPFVNNMRAEKGPGFLIDEIYNAWLKDKDKYPGGFVASGMRAIGEAEAIQALHGINIFVDADPQVRYRRSIARQRDTIDAGKTFEEFMAIERSEIDVDPNDKNRQNLGAMKEMADIIIDNNHQTIEEFQKSAVEQLKSFLGRDLG